MVPGSHQEEEFLFSEPCLPSAHLSWISVDKQGWGPSKMPPVPSKDGGYFAADGDGVGAGGGWVLEVMGAGSLWGAGDGLSDLTSSP